jgi:hypothetical protein
VRGSSEGGAGWRIIHRNRHKIQLLLTVYRNTFILSILSIKYNVLKLFFKKTTSYYIALFQNIVEMLPQFAQ